MRILLATFLVAATALIVPQPASARVKPAQKPSTGVACVPTALKRTLDEVKRRFGPVQVISTNRPGAKIAGSGRRSKHADCRAIDFNPPRGKYKEVAAWLDKNHRGGVGTYSCGMHHIHIDVGGNARWHKCSGSKSRSAARSKARPRYASRR